MNEDRPIVFTISKTKEGCFIKTTDGRARETWVNVGKDMFTADNVISVMTRLSETFNNKGYAVLFEVD